LNKQITWLALRHQSLFKQNDDYTDKLKVNVTSETNLYISCS